MLVVSQRQVEKDKESLNMPPKPIATKLKVRVPVRPTQAPPTDVSDESLHSTSYIYFVSNTNISGPLGPNII